MIRGFPVKLIDFIRCNKDRGSLRISGSHTDGVFVLKGRVSCQDCGTTYEINEGILDLFDKTRCRNTQSLLELHTRDSIAKKFCEESYRSDNSLDAMEIPSTLRRLGNTRGKSILELGCGTGRYTRLLADSCNSILAIDFSRQSLLVNSKILSSGHNVGLVHADVSQLALKPNSFELALSTLYSNLPSLGLRLASTKLVSNALIHNGRYILSAHHYDIRERLRGIPAEGQYNNGIYYKSFTAKSLQAELQDYFSNIEYTTIATWLPYLSRIRATRVSLSRICERIPLINKLGALLMATAIKTS